MKLTGSLRRLVSRYIGSLRRLVSRYRAIINAALLITIGASLTADLVLSIRSLVRDGSVAQTALINTDTLDTGLPPDLGDLMRRVKFKPMTNKVTEVALNDVITNPTGHHVAFAHDSNHVNTHNTSDFPSEGGDDWFESTRSHMVTRRNNTIEEQPWGRLPQCAWKQYAVEELPRASIVITFHPSEPLMHLLHTIHSVLVRTPARLLHEIILVNDNSHTDEHTTVLENYLRTTLALFPIRLIRSWESLGLIRARLTGARAARGEVLVCMDSHMEVQDKWLEPMLQALVDNPRTLATSYLDWMSYDKDGVWKYRHGASNWKTYFDWDFTVGFQSMSSVEIHRRQADPTTPVETPVTIGTIWAIKRHFFVEIGSLDEGMQGWGGENVELPLRVWFCGGRVVNIPCSHAAHLEQAGQRSYRKRWQKFIHTNYKRVVDVWWGDLARLFYFYDPTAKELDAGDLSSRRKLRSQCQSEYGRNMTWLLKHVYPQIGVPDGPNTLAWNGVRNVAFNTCIDPTTTNRVRLTPCTGRAPSTGMFWDLSGMLRLPVHVITVRVIPDGYSMERTEYMPNKGSYRNARWIHWKNGPLMLYPARQCLAASSKYSMQFRPCNTTDERQQWVFGTYTELYECVSSFAKLHNMRTDLKTSLKTLAGTLPAGSRSSTIYGHFKDSLRAGLADESFIRQLVFHHKQTAET